MTNKNFLEFEKYLLPLWEENSPLNKKRSLAIERARAVLNLHEDNPDVLEKALKLAELDFMIADVQNIRNSLTDPSNLGIKNQNIVNRLHEIFALIKRKRDRLAKITPLIVDGVDDSRSWNYVYFAHLHFLKQNCYSSHNILFDPYNSSLNNENPVVPPNLFNELKQYLAWIENQTNT